jgi:hypothetical protein
MNVQDKQRAIIKFLLLEGCTGKEIMIRLWNLHGSTAYYHASVFRWISEVRRGSE